ncbi:DUF4097 family beta strand repeat-containing protein [Bacillus marinisedimentorum]|uniref:DUF4097 family beta strand repeat-containing protein n=1 Tax=Bacillus marinisedimentorum TaxID=1821260 RepID=UPI0007E20248|nr:DUF4097 domain-containing protein [Bacillus marinisedimentorum]
MNEEKRRILKLVEEGSLKAEEAAILLEALESKKEQPGEQEKEEPADSTLSTHVDPASKQGGKSYKQSATVDRFFDFIDTAVQKIKDFDLDFNFGQAFEVNHTYQHKDVYLQKINIDLSNGDVKLIPWQEKDVKVECQAKVYRVRSQEEARKTFMQSVDFSISGSSLHFGTQKKQMKVFTTIYIPEAHYEDVSVRMFNGAVTGNNISADSVKAKTANGNLTFSGLKGKEVELETANGHIAVKESSGTELEAETLNGKITMDASYVKTDLNSLNGDIVCRLTDARPERLFIRTTTGNVDLFVDEEAMVDGSLKSMLGGFKCDLPEVKVMEEQKDVVQKSLRFKANEGKPTTLFVEAETKTGSIVLKNRTE